MNSPQIVTSAQPAAQDYPNSFDFIERQRRLVLELTQEQRDAKLIEKAVAACGGFMPDQQMMANQMLTVGLRPADIDRLWGEITARLADIFAATRGAKPPFPTIEGACQ